MFLKQNFSNKKSLHLSVDRDLVKQAWDKQMNLSDFLELKLREEFENPTIELMKASVQKSFSSMADFAKYAKKLSEDAQ